MKMVDIIQNDVDLASELNLDSVFSENFDYFTDALLWGDWPVGKTEDLKKMMESLNIRDDEAIVKFLGNVDDILDKNNDNPLVLDEVSIKNDEKFWEKPKIISSENIMELFPDFDNKEDLLALVGGVDEDKQKFRKAVYEVAIHYDMSVQSIQWFLLRDMYLSDRNIVDANIELNSNELDDVVLDVNWNKDVSWTVVKAYEAFGSVEVKETIKRSTGFLFDLSGSMSKDDISAVKSSIEALKDAWLMWDNTSSHIISGVKTVNGKNYTKNIEEQNKILSTGYSYDELLGMIWKIKDGGKGSTPLEAGILESYQDGVKDLVVVTDGGSDPEAKSNWGPRFDI